LIDQNILLVARALVKGLGLRCIRDDIMQAWPKNLMTEIVVRLSKLGVRDPNRIAIVFFDHALLDVLAERLAKVIRIRAEGPDPAFALEASLERVYSVGETTIAMGIRLDVILATGGRVRGCTTCNRTSGFALRAKRDMAVMLISAKMCGSG